MKTRQTRRKFVEEMMRLKRNIINFKELGIIFPLELKISDEDVIGFNLDTNCWTVKSAIFESENWNPKLSEVISFLSNYGIIELERAIKNMEKISKTGYQSIYASALEPKFLHIMELMKLEENQIQPIVKIQIKSVLKSENKNVIYEILYIDQKFKYGIEFPDLHVATTWMPFTLANMKEILSDINYYDVMIALNQCHTNLLVKNL
jgi:hypothetical protein